MWPTSILMGSYSSVFLRFGSSFYLIGLLLTGWSILHGQNAPAPPQEESVTLRGGTIHTGNGEVIKNAHLKFENGKITYLGTARQEADRIIDVNDYHIYPGLIAPHTDLGLVEISAVRATRDFQEVGEYNPHVRAIIAYNTDSRILPTVRSNGILLAGISPQGQIITGQSSVVQLDAWNWEDALVKDTSGIHLNWPRVYTYDSKSRRLSKDKEYEKNVKNIERFFESAIAYGHRIDHGKTNLRFEALSGALKNQVPVFIRADHRKAMLDAVDWSKRLGIPIVLVGAEDSWMIAETLAKENIPVILSSTQRLPRTSDAGITSPFEAPAILEKAGVLWAISHEGSWEQRNLPFQAGQAVGFGLEEEKAIQAMTLNPARILGIDDRYGTLETGKSATLVISDGNILDPKSSIILQAFIDGREIDLNNHQKELNRKFAEKYGIEK